MDLKPTLKFELMNPAQTLCEITLGKLLKERKMTIATAESCTGGTIASLLAKHSGSSEFFKGAVVAYCNEVKHNILGVSQQTLDQQGAVSQQTVEQMAKGVRELLKTDIGISVSGVAGPTGGTPEKPVGTVWIAVANAHKVAAKKLRLTSFRDQNISQTTEEALRFAIDFIENS